MEITYPKSPYTKTRGIYYVARMLDKIRLRQQSRLDTSYLPNMGMFFDEYCCKFLGVSYGNVVEKVEAGLSDEDVLDWCFKTGGQPDEDQILVWNEFMRKRGMNDSGAKRLKERIQESGLEGRQDILTIFDFIEADEKRPVPQFDF